MPPPALAALGAVVADAGSFDESAGDDDDDDDVDSLPKRDDSPLIEDERPELGRSDGEAVELILLDEPMPRPGTDIPAAPSRLTAPRFITPESGSASGWGAAGGGGLKLPLRGGSLGGSDGGPEVAGLVASYRGGGGLGWVWFRLTGGAGGGLALRGCGDGTGAGASSC